MAKFILSAFADEASSNLEEQIQALKENDIHYIEPREINGKNVLDLTDEEALSAKKMLDEYGIKVSSLGSPIGKFPIEGDFDEYMTKVRRSFELCNIFDTKFIRVFSFFVDQDKLEFYRDEVIRRMKVMCDIAKEYGVTLCHENESDIYGQMPKEVLDLLTSVPSLGGVFDPANYRMNGANIYEGIGATLVNLKYLHIKDAIYEEQTICPAGEGEGKIPEVLTIVNGHTDGVVFLTLEPHLKLFSSFKNIDKRTFKEKYSFKDNKESFAFAATALKILLTKLGYKKENNGLWTK